MSDYFGEKTQNLLGGEINYWRLITRSNKIPLYLDNKDYVSYDRLDTRGSFGIFCRMCGQNSPGTGVIKISRAGDQYKCRKCNTATATVSLSTLSIGLEDDYDY